jgi:hypothetical protein
MPQKFPQLPEFLTVYLGVIQMALQHLSRQRLFLSNWAIHNRCSFLLFNISHDALDDFILDLENIDIVIGGWETRCIRAAGDNLHYTISIVDDPVCIQIIVAPEMGASALSRCGGIY